MTPDLVPLYRDHDDSAAVLVGGPNDGRRLDIAGRRPPEYLDTTVDPGPPMADLDTQTIYPTLRIARYRLALDEDGLPSRADDGAFRYQYHDDRRV
ncbi:hypothetical protein [Streptomyces sp. DH37]|uniref:hypothetical protein n=1 Tax=Streptomyces sp. DH37 TaxID=3040122 RepID=UPI002442DC02|nr:hypothetical protein [Streptomyces sp. DH37]MDG9703787.1 hypothetical protein [Streptomyces sp. DH37]